MDVLIKGMKMPKNCGECIWIQRGYPDWCDLPMGKDLYNDKKRPDWCPLVEVPTLHGRLIDGIDLLKAITENAYIIHHGHNEVEYGMSCFGIMQAISEAPTIIEAEGGKTDVNTD